MLRQRVRARFLIGKTRIERLAGHGFVAFPSGWHGQNNTRTLPVGKPHRTTSCAAGPKGISLEVSFGKATAENAEERHQTDWRGQKLIGGCRRAASPAA